ncbi:MAG: tRNA uracil 4-sulfurtransferase ThiI [Myxococcota bacterium]|nr:tRNA uracil 4-sulfurtransferase ThiI [Myxococcota bacterium]
MSRDDVQESTGSLVLIRYSGELTIKAPPTRNQFSKRLARNIKDGLRSIGLRSEIERRRDRLHIQFESAEAASRAVPLLTRTFGVQSVAATTQRPFATLEELVRQATELFGEAVEGKTFAVRARRVGDRSRIPVTSDEVARSLGAALAPRSAGVDLDNPQVTVSVELAPGSVHFFRDSQPGPGGLPLGVEGRAVALVSGGFDSAVAAWQLLKRGVALDYVFCNLGGRSHQLGTLRVMKHIADHWSYGLRPHFHAIEFDAVSADLQRSCTTRYWQIILKRLMLGAGERIAAERGSAALVTGEAIGQVSSQTLQNLAVISHGFDLPVLRPLVGFNKDEIVAIARRIGTFDLSKVVGEYCALVPSKPATTSTVHTIDIEQAKLDASLLDTAVAERSTFDLRELDLDSLDDPELQTSSIPKDAVLVDLRTKAAYQSWHFEGALFLDFAEALRAYPSFDAKQHYVLYCEFGLKSAHLAELMRALGLEATSFRGGAPALRKHTSS